MVGVIALPKRQIIDPIGVSETLKGQGIGTKLREGLVNFVRKEPLTAFRFALLQKHRLKKDWTCRRYFVDPTVPITLNATLP